MLPLTEKLVLPKAEQGSSHCGNRFAGSLLLVVRSASPAAANDTPLLPACLAHLRLLPPRPPPAPTRDLISLRPRPLPFLHFLL